VEPGKTSYSETSQISQTRLVIRIPPGAPAESHLGDGAGELGRIRLETNHPDVAELEIRLRFAVEE
jgi:hypothetical protein